MAKPAKKSKAAAKGASNKGGLTKNQLEARKIIAEIAEIGTEDVADTASFSDDMGIDSMKALEMVALIEKKFKIKIPEAKIGKIRTPKDVYGLLSK